MRISKFGLGHMALFFSIAVTSPVVDTIHICDDPWQNNMLITHCGISTDKIVSLMMYHAWPHDDQFSIELGAVHFSVFRNSQLVFTEIARANFNEQSWLPEFITRDFQFNIYPLSIPNAQPVGCLHLREINRQNGIFFEINHIFIDKLYRNKHLASKAIHAVVKFCDQHLEIGCTQITVLPVSHNIKIGLIYGRHGFWPYEKHKTGQNAKPMTASKAAEYFADTESFKIKYRLIPYMVRPAGAKFLPISSLHTDEQILMILIGHTQ